jgi:TRAP transporter TAXI family solute receptor
MRLSEPRARASVAAAVRLFAFCLLPYVFCISPACTQSGSPPAKYLSIGTGGTGGVYYPYGGALARLVSQKLPNVQATAEVTGGAVDNLKLLHLGKVDLAFTLADSLSEAVSGRGPFQETGPIGNLRTIAVLYTNFTHVVVRQGSGIRRVADLKGRIVSTGSPGSGTEVIADRVLGEAGIDPRRGITRHSLGATESAGAIKDGKLDAFFWSGGVPTPAVQELAATPGMSIALVPQDDLLPFLQRDFGNRLYRLALIPASAYRGLASDVPAIGVTNMLVASSALDEGLIHDLVKLMFDEKNALVAGHPEARHLAVPASEDVSPAPLHAGAFRYYNERGWK